MNVIFTIIIANVQPPHHATVAHGIQFVRGISREFIRTRYVARARMKHNIAAHQVIMVRRRMEPAVVRVARRQVVFTAHLRPAAHP